MGLKAKFIAIAFLVMCLFSETEAAWQGPAEIVSGTWGPNNDQFGIKYGDTNDVFAGPIYIGADENIIIQDVINARYKVYGANGILKKTLKCIEVSPDVYNEGCNFDGDYLQTTADGNIWVDRSKYKQPKYSLYSPTGQLIKTSTDRPLELGKVKSLSVGGGKYKTTAEYPDTTYQFVDTQPTVKYNRDLAKKFYRIETFTATTGDEDVTAYRVHKYNMCSKKVAVLDMPKSSYEPMPPSAVDMPTWKPAPIMEYGAPLVAPTGDVYCWARTKTQYKILKWTWVDDPNIPSGPDAPTSLAAVPSLNGIALSWKASPQDPGCVTTYEIYRATSAGGVGATIGTVNAGQLKYNDTTATAGTTYYYKVRAMSGSDASPYTSEVSTKR